MMNPQNNMQPTPFYERDMLLYNPVQRLLYTFVLDAINNELDVIVNLLSEGDKLLEAIESETNIDDITMIVRNLNNRLLQHAKSMNALKCICGGDKSEEIKHS